MRASLSKKNVDVTEREFFEDPLSEKELKSIIGEFSPTEFFSWRSPSFRNLGLKRDSLRDDELISLMLKDPRLIRRPILLVNGRFVDWRNQGALDKTTTP